MRLLDASLNSASSSTPLQTMPNCMLDAQTANHQPGSSPAFARVFGNLDAEEKIILLTVILPQVIELTTALTIELKEPNPSPRLLCIPLKVIYEKDPTNY
ncbi:hypothetical protein AMTR_s00009p00259300 [Amborella trichopoda]|uniref:Uncharacterized protein n=1 Tax=Amborella trichopoda TaxID=13333 RepID=W1NI27_AMBTC|nr:hypothetical protein AMTR_s00009p00259300 [Amborella trichopoda]